jgi:ubiquinone/menaquinone biosynthesis C-methylase UbiE
MDVRDLKYDDNTFDLAVDKSTIDALLCGDKSFLNVSIMLKEVQRVLKVGGIYMIISYGQPENRVFHLEREHLMFDINIYTIKKDYCVEENDQNFEKVFMLIIRFIMFIFVGKKLMLIVYQILIILT